jgi:isopenicillin N synthase-like dioxygenase
LQSINHGITSSFLDKVRSVTKQFFALPMEEKKSTPEKLKAQKVMGMTWFFQKIKYLIGKTDYILK